MPVPIRRSLCLTVAIAVVAAAAVAVAERSAHQASAADCDGTSVGFVPLSELGTGTHGGFEGGLYPGGLNVPPEPHRAAALARSAALGPIDTAGAPADDGRIVILSIGMSNTTQEYAAFMALAAEDPQVHPRVLLVDGAQGGQPAQDINTPDARFWQVVDQRLAAAGSSREQVQVLWMKQAHRQPSLPFPEDARALQADLAEIMQISNDRFPSLRIAYLSSRTYAGYASTTLNPEPYAYQGGFAVKWLIEQQMEGDPTLNPHADAGPVRAPLLLWGPYLWADGMTPRGDGLIWTCEDFRDDGTHPSDPYGRRRVGNLLLSFFKADETTRGWFTIDPGATPVPTATTGPGAPVRPGPGPGPGRTPGTPGTPGTPDPGTPGPGTPDPVEPTATMEPGGTAAPRETATDEPTPTGVGVGGGTLYVPWLATGR